MSFSCKVWNIYLFSNIVMYERYFKITDPFKFAAEKTGREKSWNNRKQTSDYYRLLTVLPKETSGETCLLVLLYLPIITKCCYWFWLLITGIEHITFRWAKRKVVYNWFEMDIIVLARKCFRKVWLNDILLIWRYDFVLMNLLR